MLKELVVDCMFVFEFKNFDHVTGVLCLCVVKCIYVKNESFVLIWNTMEKLQVPFTKLLLLTCFSNKLKQKKMAQQGPSEMNSVFSSHKVLLPSKSAFITSSGSV